MINVRHDCEVRIVGRQLRLVDLAGQCLAVHELVGLQEAHSQIHRWAASHKLFLPDALWMARDYFDDLEDAR